MRETAMVDQKELRIMQGLTVAMLSVAYVIDDWRLVILQCGFFLLTTLSLSVSPYVLLYRFLLKPLGLMKPDMREDNIEAHRFATFIGMGVSALAGFFLYIGETAIGWGLVWLIIALGSIALLGWCAGCFTYYMLNRMGLKGFFRYTPTPGTALPGARPPKRY